MSDEPTTPDPLAPTQPTDVPAAAPEPVVTPDPAAPAPEPVPEPAPAGDAAPAPEPAPAGDGGVAAPPSSDFPEPKTADDEDSAPVV